MFLAILGRGTERCRFLDSRGRVFFRIAAGELGLKNFAAGLVQSPQPEISVQITALQCLEMFNYLERSFLQRPLQVQHAGPRVRYPGFHPNLL